MKMERKSQPGGGGSWVSEIAAVSRDNCIDPKHFKSHFFLFIQLIQSTMCEEKDDLEDLREPQMLANPVLSHTLRWQEAHHRGSRGAYRPAPLGSYLTPPQKFSAPYTSRVLWETKLLHRKDNSTKAKPRKVIHNAILIDKAIITPIANVSFLLE